MGELQQRIRWVTVAILVGVALLLTFLDSTGNLDSAFAVVRDPLTAVLGWTTARVDSIAYAISGPREIQDARAQITDLQTQLEQLERENEELREIQGEYQQLLDLFNRARQTPELRRQIASVIGQDTNPSLRSIIIDKGSDDGIRVGMPVESTRGLVGQIYRTSGRSAQVVLITDNTSAIPARLGNSRATGLLRGGGLGGPVRIDWIDLKYQLGTTEVVLTSGLGGKFPENIVIGQVIEVDRREAELSQQAIVQPAVDFDSLEMVFVITDFQPVDIEIFDTPPGG